MQVADWRDRQFADIGRPVPPANFHLTLAFLGAVSDSVLERVCLAADSWVAGSAVAGGALTLDCTGYWARPGIYWLGPGTWPDSLSQLARKLGQLATSAGARRDRNPFRPHVTLFRHCTAAPAVADPRFQLTYQHFTLFESRQGKTGVRYQPLQHWQLSTREID